MKDNFSKQSKEYSKYRPVYPKELIEYLTSLTTLQKNVWDCGTGNGQLAVKLSEYFEKVFATDISKNQINNAVQRNNIIYKVESAEKTHFENNQFDLITVAQAIHWFDFEKFYKEVKRTLKPNGIIAVIGYTLPKINMEIDAIINNFYSGILGKYWDKERKYIDEEYKKNPFPFKELQTPSFIITNNWRCENLIGYLNSWSATQHFIKTHNVNPINQIYQTLRDKWKDNQVKQVTFPIVLRAGKL